MALPVSLCTVVFPVFAFFKCDVLSTINLSKLVLETETGRTDNGQLGETGQSRREKQREVDQSLVFMILFWSIFIQKKKLL